MFQGKLSLKQNVFPGEKLSTPNDRNMKSAKISAIGLSEDRLFFFNNKILFENSEDQLL